MEHSFNSSAVRRLEAPASVAAGFDNETPGSSTMGAREKYCVTWGNSRWDSGTNGDEVSGMTHEREDSPERIC